MLTNLTVHQVVRKLTAKEPSPVLLPEGLRPQIARGAISHFYGINPELEVNFLPIEKDTPPPKGALVAQAPITVFAETDPKKVLITFRVAP